VTPGEAANSAGYLLWLVRTGRARTRAELQRYTGLSRSTVSQRLDALRTSGHLRASGVDESTGGRPPTVLEFNDRHAVAAVADLGATHARLAIMDLGGRVLAEYADEMRIAQGPEPVLAWVTEQLRALLAEAGEPAERVCAVGVGVPGPVEFEAGLVRQPPIMPGWDGYPIADRLREVWGVPVLVDNDANLMARGEQVTNFPDCPAMMLVKVATGIGAGIIVNGAVYRGIDGGAGDIGHIRLHDRAEARCMCGLRGCLAAVASGSALAQRLTELGTPTRTGPELVERIRAGHPDAVRLSREAGFRVGEVLATAVCLLNPGVLVVAGDLADTHFVTGLREVLYQRALPRATRHLEVVTSGLGARAGIAGAHAMVVDHVYAPAAVDARLAEADG
jgi:predicted NBD/HSP70 family sugar kinase